MNLIPRDTLMDLDSMFEKMLGPVRGSGEGQQGFFSPRIDIRETKDSYEISAELAGVNKEDVNVTVENGVLMIEAELNEEHKEEEGSRVIRRERRYGKFSRSFNLGSDIREDEVDATFDKGVLTLKVPKREARVPASHRVEIH